MKRLAFLFIMMIGVVAAVSAQDFKGHFINDELKINLDINLYNDSIQVPGLSDEFCYGYLRGNTNGMWVILKVISLNKDKALVRAACDNGSDAQNLEITTADGKLQIKQVDGSLIKGLSGKKYVKLPKTFTVHK